MEVILDCGHPALVTHEMGERRVFCAVQGCPGMNVVAAHTTKDTTYTVFRAPAPGDDEPATLDLEDAS